MMSENNKMKGNVQIIHNYSTKVLEKDIEYKKELILLEQQKKEPSCKLIFFSASCSNLSESSEDSELINVENQPETSNTICNIIKDKPKKKNNSFLTSALIGGAATAALGVYIMSKKNK
jgi:hypothetical protein